MIDAAIISTFSINVSKGIYLKKNRVQAKKKTQGFAHLFNQYILQRQGVVNLTRTVEFTRRPVFWCVAVALIAVL